MKRKGKEKSGLKKWKTPEKTQQQQKDNNCGTRNNATNTKH